MRRKQFNINLNEEEKDLIQRAAGKQPWTVFIRDAALAAAKEATAASRQEE